jgi:hypothetical protein
VLVRYVKVVTTEDGGSKFIDEVDVAQTSAPFAENVPPLLVSQPVAVHDLLFVTCPDPIDSEPHPAPRRQLCVVVEGEFELETTDGDSRTFPSGGMVVVEDTVGRGHVTRTSKPGASFVAVALTDE